MPRCTSPRKAGATASLPAENAAPAVECGRRQDVAHADREHRGQCAGGQAPLDGGVTGIGEQGAAVGLFPFARYATFERRLPARFLLAVFSDGVLDILPQPTLEQKLGFLQSLGSDAGIGRFLAVIKTNTQPPDDVTVLTIKREETQHGD